MKTKVSVVIPVYNQQELVIKAIKSVPVREDVEIIVVDDCSTDDTAKNVSDYLYEQDRGVLLIHQEKNLGVGAAVNEGLDLSNGEYIVLLGADDYFLTDKFEQVMDELDGTDLVYSAYEPKRFSPKREIFGSNVKLKLRDYAIDKNGNSIKSSNDKNGFISKDYGTRSKIPELALKDFFEQAIDFIERGCNGE